MYAVSTSTPVVKPIAVYPDFEGGHPLKIAIAKYSSPRKGVVKPVKRRSPYYEVDPEWEDLWVGESRVPEKPAAHREKKRGRRLGTPARGKNRPSEAKFYYYGEDNKGCIAV